MESASQVPPASDENGEDWREAVYERIVSMKEMYLTELLKLHQRVIEKIVELESLQEPMGPIWMEKLGTYRCLLERAISFLYVSKTQLTPAYAVWLDRYECQIPRLIGLNRPPTPVSISSKIKKVMAPRAFGAVYMQRAQSQATQQHFHG